MHIVQRSLDTSIQFNILNKSVYDSWTTLATTYGSAGSTKKLNAFEMYQAFCHMYFGEKVGESMEDFSHRWVMMAQQIAQVTGDLRTDAMRSILFEKALPRAWRPTIATWHSNRSWIPFGELIDKAIDKDKHTAQTKSTGSREPREEQVSTRTMEEVKRCCFYCLRTNHAFQQCNHLRRDIETGKTHQQHCLYACKVTEQRTQPMVEALEKYIAEVNEAHSSTTTREGRKRDRTIDLSQDTDRGIQSRPPTSCDFGRRSQSRPRPPRDFGRRSPSRPREFGQRSQSRTREFGQRSQSRPREFGQRSQSRPREFGQRSQSRPPPPRSTFHRSQSAYSSTSKRSPSRNGQSRSNGIDARSTSSLRNFNFPQRNRSPSFEHRLASSP
ncbi:hypothetical protein PHMEG_00026555 [Phytophthora megakarya]|uniref:Uncharacterized protein n=1 Tax=Phytophthora megakarya TaxID=4795 RepID=A0A225V853_9STRA|nr:hypothetical protein PHMEG_00026555 [Phytophthora megakarya]